jgi:hypothetical protein
MQSLAQWPPDFQFFTAGNSLELIGAGNNSKAVFCAVFDR